LFNHARNGVGAAALATLLGQDSAVAEPARKVALPDLPHHAPTAKRVIYLFQSGGPSHIDMWDYKPNLTTMHGKPLPDSVKGTQRVTGMTAGQKQFLTNAPIEPFQQHGQCGRWVSDLLPHTAQVVDDLAVLKAVHTEAINHDPAITFFQTGSQQPGRPCMGSWLSYGMGSMNDNLPTFTVLLSRGTGRKFGQPLYSRLWGNGFLHSLHQGVQFRSGKGDFRQLLNEQFYR
jgi:hypothetical protein